MANSHVRNRASIESLGILTGSGGADYVAPSGSNSTLSSHIYVAIQTLSVDTIISATSTDTDIWDSLSSVTIPAETTIYGRWSSITVTDGDIAILYRESSTNVA